MTTGTLPAQLYPRPGAAVDISDWATTADPLWLAQYVTGVRGAMHRELRQALHTYDPTRIPDLGRHGEALIDPATLTGWLRHHRPLVYFLTAAYSATRHTPCVLDPDWLDRYAHHDPRHLQAAGDTLAALGYTPDVDPHSVALAALASAR